MNQRPIDNKCQGLRDTGWRPNRLVHDHSRDGQLAELTCYPFPSDDGESILVYARSTPGDPTTNQLYIVVGEDKQWHDLSIATVQCPNCNNHWPPVVAGEFKQAHLECPNCLRTYPATYDNDTFLGFQSIIHGR